MYRNIIVQLLFFVTGFLMLASFSNTYAITCNYHQTESSGINYCCYEIDSPEDVQNLTVGFQCATVDGYPGLCNGSLNDSERNTGERLEVSFENVDVIQEFGGGDIYSACVTVPNNIIDVSSAYAYELSIAEEVCEDATDYDECLDLEFYDSLIQINSYPSYNGADLVPKLLVVELHSDGSVVVNDTYSDIYDPHAPYYPNSGEVVYSSIIQHNLNIDCDVGSGSGIDTAIGCIPTNPTDFLAFFIWFGIGIAGGIGFLVILMGGLKMMTSRGNPERLMEGKDQIGGAMAGLLLIIFAVFLMRFIGYDVLRIPGFG
ncbi:hypothetical protein ACFL1P_01285 [Patescibacteria group bacterium]